jgi:hypothetical protein
MSAVLLLVLTEANEHYLEEKQQYAIFTNTNAEYAKYVNL